MFCLIISLMKVTITGMLWHEILGIAIFIVFIFHKFLNLNWIKAIGKNIFSGKVNTKTKVTFFIDFLMLIATILTAISGIGISKNILTQFEFNDIQLWTIIHYISAYSLFALISIHLGMHLKTIITSIKRAFNVKNENGDSKLGRYIAIIFAAIGLIAYISDKKLVEIYDFFTNKETNTSNNSNSTTSNSITEVSFDSDDSKYKLIAVDTSSNDATLQEKLSSTICTGCRRRCPLSSPQCSIGEQQAEKLIASYNSSKASTSTTTEDSNSNSSSSSNSSNSTTSSNTTTTNDIEVTENVDETINNVETQNDTTYSTSSDDSTYTVDDLVPAENTNETTSSTTPVDITRSLLEMGFWIGGTYYIVEKIERKKSINKNTNTN